jgi:hypothetical protein
VISKPHIIATPWLRKSSNNQFDSSSGNVKKKFRQVQGENVKRIFDTFKFTFKVEENLFIELQMGTDAFIA